jgi:hypothetical protein
VEGANERTGDQDDVERYEQLRRHALGGEPSGWRLGLALFQRQGMAAWLRACRDTSPMSLSSPTRPSDGESAGRDGDLVGVLANMALACVAG